MHSIKKKSGTGLGIRGAKSKKKSLIKAWFNPVPYAKSRFASIFNGCVNGLI